MKNVLIALALVALCSGTLFAADVSDQTLAKMGLSGMQSVSDAQGLQIRGMGTQASVFGVTAAWTRNSADVNGYHAEAEHRRGDSFAVGASIGVAVKGGYNSATGNWRISGGAAVGASVAYAR